MICRHASGADISDSFRRQELDMRSGEHGDCTERGSVKGVRCLGGAKPSYSLIFFLRKGFTYERTF